MQTPDEIKKGLNFNNIDHCNECPYDGLDCAKHVDQDALAYIQQLESRLAQVERERDAAVAAIPEIAKDGYVCTGCINNVGLDKRCKEADFNCNECKYPCKCKNCESNSNYKWRGVCEENTKEEEE